MHFISIGVTFGNIWKVIWSLSYFGPNGIIYGHGNSIKCDYLTMCRDNFNIAFRNKSRCVATILVCFE